MSYSLMEGVMPEGGTFLEGLRECVAAYNHQPVTQAPASWNSLMGILMGLISSHGPERMCQLMPGLPAALGRATPEEWERLRARPGIGDLVNRLQRLAVSS